MIASNQAENVRREKFLAANLEVGLAVFDEEWYKSGGYVSCLTHLLACASLYHTEVSLDDAADEPIVV